MILIVGNFSFALSYSVCTADSDALSSCEEECCGLSDRYSEDEAKPGISETAAKVECCEVHIETSSEKDLPMPTFSKFPDKVRYFGYTYIAIPPLPVSKFFPESNNKIKSSKIIFEVISLRI